MKRIKSPVKWMGAKTAMAPWVIDHFCDHRTYVEPFGGGAAVLLRKAPSIAEVYNDLDERLIAIFTVLRDPKKAAALKRSLQLTPYSEAEYHEAWQASRKISDIERARLAVVSLRFCFGGAAASGRKSGFSYSIKNNEAAQFRNFVDSLDSLIDRIKHLTITSRDAIALITELDDPETLFYIDPPYEPSTRTSVLYKHEMSVSQHEQLLSVITRAKGKIVLSGYANELYDRELREWHRIERTYALQASAGRGTRVEVLWRNF